MEDYFFQMAGPCHKAIQKSLSQTLLSKKNLSFRATENSQPVTMVLTWESTQRDPQDLVAPNSIAWIDFLQVGIG